MPVTRPLLSCSPFLSFQSALRASGQSCAQCPSFLHNLHFVQPKSHVHSSHTVHICAASCCFNLYNSQLHLSLPSSLARSCLCVPLRLSWTENSRGRGEFQCIQLSHWVDVCFISGGAGLTVFSCGKHKHTVG